MPQYIEGLFTRQELGKPNSKPSKTQQNNSVELAKQAGLSGVRNMNPTAKHPMIEPTGSNTPLVYVLTGFPTYDEDRAGELLADQTGDLFFGLVPNEYKKALRINACVRTNPKNDERPNAFQTECFRADVQHDIELSKPNIIIGFGSFVFMWLTGLKGGMKQSIRVARGKRFRVKVGGHVCWFFPVMSPYSIEGAHSSEDANEKIYDDEWKTMFKHDIKNAFSHVNDELPNSVMSQTELQRNIDVLSFDDSSIDRLENYFASKAICAVDTESWPMRPYEVGAKLICVSFSWGEQTVVVPYQHYQCQWTTKQFKRVDALIYRFMCNDCPKIFHHAAHDLEWFVYIYGPKVARACTYHCTMSQAFIIDERQGGHGLDYVACQHLGTTIKDAFKFDKKHMDNEPLNQIMPYCGLDTVTTYYVYFEQKNVLKHDDKLLNAYFEQLSRIPTIVLTQIAGFPVDQQVALKFQGDTKQKINAIESKIKQLPEVIEFDKTHQSFSASKSEQIASLLCSMGVDLPRTENGNFSTDKNALQAIPQSISELPKLILDYREQSTLLGTFINPLCIGHDGCVVWPDSMLHTIYNTVISRTGRLTSEEPNLQNFPKRNNAWVRGAMVAPPGFYILSADYGQIEARIIGTVSHDVQFCKSLFENWDVHLYWAERLASVWPDALKKHGHGSIKKLRSWIKTGAVFPWFYGAGAASVARVIGVPKQKFSVIYDLYAEFWDMFKQIKLWQDTLIAFYEKHKYVECKNGRRRHGPLNTNMILNTPIQGSSSDIVVDAMTRCSLQADEDESLSYMQPRLNIHDDLTFLVPKKKVDEAAERIISTMISPPFDWITVPIVVEASIGTNWADMQEFGKFDSREV